MFKKKKLKCAFYMPESAVIFIYILLPPEKAVNIKSCSFS